jgi:hypothetical protein
VTSSFACGVTANDLPNCRRAHKHGVPDDREDRTPNTRCRPRPLFEPWHNEIEQENNEGNHDRGNRDPHWLRVYQKAAAALSSKPYSDKRNYQELAPCWVSQKAKNYVCPRLYNH